MKRLTAFILCLIFVIGTIIPVMANSEESSYAESLVEFKGYSARTKHYNGVRAEYSLDTATLASLEHDYDVTIGVLINCGVENYSDLTIENAKINSVLYENGVYI